MALSSLSNTFSKVDFPTFVSPTKATGMPFFNALPTRKDSESFRINRSIVVANDLSCVRSANSTSSSLKSSSNSTNETKSSN